MEYLEIKQPPMFISFLDTDREKVIINLNQAVETYKSSEKGYYLSTQENIYNITIEQFNKLEAALKDFIINLED